MCVCEREAANVRYSPMQRIRDKDRVVGKKSALPRSLPQNSDVVFVFVCSLDLKWPEGSDDHDHDEYKDARERYALHRHATSTRIPVNPRTRALTTLLKSSRRIAAAAFHSSNRIYRIGGLPSRNAIRSRGRFLCAVIRVARHGQNENFLEQLYWRQTAGLAVIICIL